MTQKYQRLESDRDRLSNSFHDQRLAYERRLEWTRSEARMTARNVSEIHVNERNVVVMGGWALKRPGSIGG